MPEIIVKLGDRVIHRYFFDKEVLSIGRARDNDIVIENLSVSRNHAKIKRQEGGYQLVDMNSANGTLVNGVKVAKADIVHNDEITVGKHTLHFILQPAEAPSGAMPAAAGPAAAAPVASGTAHMTGMIGIFTVTKGKQLGQEFRAYKPETNIGRASDNDIRLHDWFVSKRHAVILREGNSYSLKDLDSWRGSTVNGQSVRQAELRDGDELVFGTTALQFRRVDAAALPALAPPSAEPPEDYDQASQQNLGDNLEAELDSVRAPEGVMPPLAPPPSADHDDEFAPMTEDELEALESEADLHMESDEEEEEHRRASWELAEAEKMFDLADGEGFSLIEKDAVLREQEEAAVSPPPASDAVPSPLAPEEVEELDGEEEEGLYGGRMTNEEPLGERPRSPEDSAVSPAVAVAPAPSPAPTSASSAAVPLDPRAREIAMWEKALRNKSAVIRKNAAKELKKLTGKDYDWNTEPTGS